MKIGLQMPRFVVPGGTQAIGRELLDVARHAEEAGFDSLWVMDHFFQIQWVGEVDDPMLEAYTTLGAIAAVTQRVSLGTMVTGVIYRHPGILVKTVTTLDVLSGGRAYFGIGAAWFEREALGLGAPFPALKVRFEWLEEALQIAHQMWSENGQLYEGKHFKLEETLNRPQPVSQPHPPILIGGMGEKKTLRLVAQYADACNLFARQGMDVIRHKLDVLWQHCEDLGRPYEEIEKTTLSSVHLAPDKQSAADVIDFCQQLSDAGIHHALFNMPNMYDRTPLDIFGKEILPVVHEF